MLLQLTGYQAPVMDEWQGRNDGPSLRFFQRINPLHLQEDLPQASSTPWALLGFCCDEGVYRNHGRRGAYKGPAALRQSLANMAYHSTLPTLFDAGDIQCLGSDLESAQMHLGRAVAKLRTAGYRVLVLGGGHETAWGHFQGLAETDLAGAQILNWDAHLDMRPLEAGKGSSGTPFLQIANWLQENSKPFSYHCWGLQRLANTQMLLEVAQEHQVDMCFADSFSEASWRVNQLIANKKPIYMSLCCDVFQAAQAPGVSAPQPLGLSAGELIPYIQRLARSGLVEAMDIVELAPSLDGPGEPTARLAASCVAEFLNHVQ